MKVRITIVGESNAANEADLAQLRGLLANQLTRFEMSSAGFGVGIRKLGIVDVAEDAVSPTGAEQAVPDYDLDLDKLTVPDLVAMASARGVEVTRADGRTDLDPLKADYVAALS